MPLVGLLLLGCPPDEPTDSGESDVADAQQDTPDLGPPPEKYIPPPPQPGACEVGIGSPAKGEHATGEITIKAAAAHTDLDMSRAVGQIRPCDGSADAETLAEIPQSDWDGIEFTWTWDGDGKKSGDYCITIAAEATLPGDAHETWKTPSCQAELTFYLDNDAPIVVVEAPVDAAKQGLYFQNLPVSFKFADFTAVESMRLKIEGEVIRDWTIENDGIGEFEILDDIDVCVYGTGKVDVTIEATDTLGNTADTEIAPRIIRCPQFVTSKVIPPAAGLEPNFIARHDMDGDGRLDLLGATGSGVVLYRNDGLGSFEPPIQIPGVDRSSKFVIPDDVDGEGTPDLIVFESEGDATTISVYLWAEVCTKDETFTAADVAEKELPEFHPLVCAPGFGRAQEISVPAAVTAVKYVNMASDPLPGGVTEKLSDLIVGTAKGDYAIGILLRAEGKAKYTDAAGAEQSVARCRYWTPRWDLEGEPLEPLEHEKAECFLAPKFTQGLAGITSIDVDDFVEEEGVDPVLDVIVGRANVPAITVFPHDGKGVLKGGHTAGLKAPAVQVIAGQFNVDNGSPLAPQHADALLVLRELGQIWQWQGDGQGGWVLVEEPGTAAGLLYERRRATCIEGGPSAAWYGQLGTEFALVAANAITGTLWRLDAVQTGDEALGTNFREPALVDLIPNASQLMVFHVDPDAHMDAVALSDGGAIVVVRGANPDLPATHPLYGEVGQFIGATNIPTRIPEQADKNYHVCDVPKVSLSDKASLGTPEERLTPVQLAVEDFTQDTLPDLLVVTESSTVGSGESEEARVPILLFSSDGVKPDNFLVHTDFIPYTMYCSPGVAGDPEACPSPYGPKKGDTSAVATGTFDSQNGPDYAVATKTFYNSAPPGKAGPEYPEYPALDILYQQDDGGFEQAEKTALYPYSEEDFWTQYGYIVGSRPKSMVAFHCGGTTDFHHDVAVLFDRSDDLGQRAGINVQESSGGESFAQGFLYYFGSEVKTQLIRAVHLSVIEGEDSLTDLAVLTSTGVALFTGKIGCQFQWAYDLEVGAGARGFAVADLDNDGFSEVVATQDDGTVSIAKGIDGTAFNPPDPTLKAPSSGPIQPEIVDINGDGALDIIILDPGAARLLVFVHTGNDDKPYWPTPYEIKTAPGPTEYLVRDLDLDGCKDVLVMSPVSKAVSHLRNRASMLGGCLDLPTTPL